jgi:CHAT domain-containing protein
MKRDGGNMLRIMFFIVALLSLSIMTSEVGAQDVRAYSPLIKRDSFDVYTPVWAKEASEFLDRGVQAFNEGKYDEAVTFYQKAQKWLQHNNKAVKTNPEYVQVLFEIGRCRLKKKSYSQAIERFKEVLDAIGDEKSLSSRYSLPTVGLLGRCHLERGLSALRDVRLSEEEECEKKSRNWCEQKRCLNLSLPGRMDAAMKRQRDAQGSDFSQAQYYFDQAIKIISESGSSPGGDGARRQANYHLRAAIACAGMGDIEKAIQRCHAAQELDTANPRKIQLQEWRQVFVYSDAGTLSKSSDLDADAVQMALDAELRSRSIARIRAALVGSRLEARSFIEALKTAEGAVRLANQPSSAPSSVGLYFQEAMRSMSQCKTAPGVRGNKGVGDALDLILAEYALGVSEAFLKKRQLTHVAYYANLARELTKNRQELALLDQSVMKLAEFSRIAGQYETALNLNQEAIDRLKKAGYIASEGMAYHIRGRIFRDMGQYLKADECYAEAWRKTPSLWACVPVLLEDGLSKIERSGYDFYAGMDKHEKVSGIDFISGIKEIQLGAKIAEEIVKTRVPLYLARCQIRAAECKVCAERSKILAEYCKKHPIFCELAEEYAKLCDRHCSDLAKQCNVDEIRNRVLYDFVRLVEDGVDGDIFSLLSLSGLSPTVIECFKKKGRPVWAAPIHFNEGDYATALKKYKDMEIEARQSGDSKYLAAAYTGMGASYEGLKSYREAAENYQKAVEITEESRASIGNKGKHGFFQASLGGTFRTAPYEGMARVLVKACKGASEGKPTRRDKAGSRGKPVDKICQAEEALRYCEKSRARVLAEDLASQMKEMPGPVPKIVADTDKEINARLARIRSDIQKAIADGQEGVRQSLDREREEARRELAAHVRALHKHHPALASSLYPEETDLYNITIGEDRWILYYDVTSEGVIIFLLHGKNIVKAYLEPIKREELSNLVGQFRHGLADPFQFDLKVASKLSDVLLKGIIDILPQNAHVTVIPDEMLAKAPFEALTLGAVGSFSFTDAQGRKVTSEEFNKAEKPAVKCAGVEFFGDRNQLSYCQSLKALSLMKTIHGGKDLKSEKMLVVADPVFKKRDPRLARPAKARWMKDFTGHEDARLYHRSGFSDMLCHSLWKTYGDKADIYMGVDANKDFFFNKLAPRIGEYRVILFDTHGGYSGGATEPELELSLASTQKEVAKAGSKEASKEGANNLKMSEIVGKLSLASDLVVLSACQTGRGQAVAGEGIVGFSNAFQVAGSRSVIVTLWSVRDRPSIELMESFFRHYHSGKDKVEALRLARDDIRKSGWDHPAFWSPYVLWGEVD